MNKIVEYEKKIADLEAKLAESEKQIKDARETANMSVDSWCKNRRKYEAQIAEMQNKSFILYSMLYETLEKQGCDNVASQIDQMTGWTYDKEADWLKGNRNYDQLKQQLAESENKCRECKHLNKKIELNIKNKLMAENCELQKQLAEKTLTIEQINKAFIENRSLWKGKYERANQDKISFAVEQIRELRKEFAKRYVGYNWDDNIMVAKCCMMINDVFDNKIAELTHQHEDKGE